MTRRRTLSTLVALVAFSVVTAFGAGCGKDDSITRQGAGNLQWRPNKVSFSSVGIGSTATETLTLENSGEADLRVFRMEFKPKGDASIEDLTIKNKPSDGFTLGPDKTKDLTIEYAPTEAGRTNAGVIEVYNSGADSRDDPAQIDVDTGSASPRMNIKAVDGKFRDGTIQFKLHPPGEKSTQTFEIENIGKAPLELYEFSISGSEDYRLKDVSPQLPATLKPSEGLSGESVELTLEYAPTADGSSTAELVINSNEEPGSNESSPSIKRVPINAGADSACLLVDGTVRNLGPVPIGESTTEAITIENCGSDTLEISKIEFAAESKEYSMSLGQFDENGDGELDDPIRIEEQGASKNIAVDYEPGDEGTDRTKLVLHSNDPAQPTTEIQLIARGAKGECPEANVVAKPDTAGGAWRTSITAAPLDYVLLDASESEDPDGRITSYDWHVIEKPDGATVNFGPWRDAAEDNQAKRRFRLLTAGTYKIGLTLKDNDGFESCEEGRISVTAIPNEKVHVELTWTNPEDPDETDDEGSDVDVHMLKMGPGKWFEAPYDIYFRNKGGESVWSPESPSLDIDDTDGAGPENIQLNDPQQCQWYAVGVHYYKQLFGTAYATVRIYINERLVFEKLNRPLTMGGQFWDVARIHWPSGRVYPVGNMLPAPPVEKAPPVTDNMKNSGLCTAQKLY